MRGEYKYLWNRGHYREIFGYSDDSFTALGLAEKYSTLVRATASIEDRNILSEAFSVLNTQLSRQLFNDCRRIMQEQIRRRIGEESFDRYEDNIWNDLWKWVSERYKPPPHHLVEHIIQRYRPGASRPPSLATQPLARPPET